MLFRSVSIFPTYPTSVLRIYRHYDCNDGIQKPKAIRRLSRTGSKLTSSTPGTHLIVAGWFTSHHYQTSHPLQAPLKPRHSCRQKSILAAVAHRTPRGRGHDLSYISKSSLDFVLDCYIPIIRRGCEHMHTRP